MQHKPKYKALEKGTVPTQRSQWAVVVRGKILDYAQKGADIACGCMLAPEVSQEGVRRRIRCNEECRVEIQERQYHDCTRKDVLKYFIDFEAMHTIPKEVLEENPGRKIKEYEYRRLNLKSVPY